MEAEFKVTKQRLSVLELVAPPGKWSSLAC
jgi:Fe2+ or Zn2+ uptake regulation protein